MNNPYAEKLKLLARHSVDIHKLNSESVLSLLTVEMEVLKLKLKSTLWDLHNELQTTKHALDEYKAAIDIIEDKLKSSNGKITSAFLVDLIKKLQDEGLR